MLTWRLTDLFHFTTEFQRTVISIGEIRPLPASKETDMQDLSALIRKDSIMFEYDVHDMGRAVQWYAEIFGFETVFEGGDCHTEFALPIPGVRLALSLVDEDVEIRKGARLFIPVDDIYAVEVYLKQKGVKTQPIENTHDVVLILWVKDSEGNHLAFEQWIGR
jgi:predicted enzyme related to lactoylglutathione lyase